MTSSDMPGIDAAAPRSEETLAIKRLPPDRTVEQLVVRELRKLIIEGRLRPGVRLPLRDLANQFGVSVTPVRIALRVLAQEGLVETQSSGGVSVTSLSSEELEELYATRNGLESWLARQGAPRLSDEQVEAMEGTYASIEASAQARDRMAFVAHALDYRRACYGAAGRPRMLDSLDVLLERSARYSGLTIESDARLTAAFQLASEFRDASVARDGQRAQSAVRATLDASLDHLVLQLPRLSADLASSDAERAASA